MYVCSHTKLHMHMWKLPIFNTHVGIAYIQHIRYVKPKLFPESPLQTLGRARLLGPLLK